MRPEDERVVERLHEALDRTVGLVADLNERTAALEEATRVVARALVDVIERAEANGSKG